LRFATTAGSTPEAQVTCTSLRPLFSLPDAQTREKASMTVLNGTKAVAVIIGTAADLFFFPLAGLRERTIVRSSKLVNRFSLRCVERAVEESNAGWEEREYFIRTVVSSLVSDDSGTGGGAFAF